MTTQETCRLIEEATYFVNVYLSEGELQPELISEGSAVAFNSVGDLLTAAHVVTTRLPLREEDVRDPNAVIVAMRRGGQLKRYQPLLCGLIINLVDCLTTPITIDLAILRPSDPEPHLPFLPLSNESPQLGDRILMAGYPDDVKLPFSFDRILNRANPQVNAQRLNLDIARRLLMVRSGMVGHRSGVTINEDHSGHIFYVDNALHPGASGGPVVDQEGRIVGILTERAITAVPYENTPNLRVPSGAGVALTPRIILPELRALGILH
jgi:hypothetical protein